MREEMSETSGGSRESVRHLMVEVFEYLAECESALFKFASGRADARFQVSVAQAACQNAKGALYDALAVATTDDEQNQQAGNATTDDEQNQAGGMSAWEVSKLSELIEMGSDEIPQEAIERALRERQEVISYLRVMHLWDGTLGATVSTLSHQYEDTRDALLAKLTDMGVEKAGEYHVLNAPLPVLAASLEKKIEAQADMLARVQYVAAKHKWPRGKVELDTFLAQYMETILAKLRSQVEYQIESEGVEPAVEQASDET